MTTTEANQAASSEARLLRPEEIGLVVKTHRTMRGWTQETLAELSSGLQTRTIQRVERANRAASTRAGPLQGPSNSTILTSSIRPTLWPRTSTCGRRRRRCTEGNFCSTRARSMDGSYLT